MADQQHRERLPGGDVPPASTFTAAMQVVDPTRRSLRAPDMTDGSEGAAHSRGADSRGADSHRIDSHKADSRQADSHRTDRDARRRVRPSRQAWRHSRKRPSRGLGLRWLLALLVVVVTTGGLLGATYQVYPDQVKMLFGWKDDYAGAGSGSVQIVIRPDDTGLDVAQTLSGHGVTKTTQAFYTLLLRTKPEPTLLPGTYRLSKHESAARALAQLQDPSHLIVASVLIPEGSTVAQILSRTAKDTGVPIAELKAAAKDYTALGVPASAPRLEGYLFPATYNFQPGTSAVAMLKTMVQRMYQALDADGVPVASRARILTLAGLVQKEGNGADDAKVARVFVNRIARGMFLQSDASVSYGAGGTTVVPTAKQYASKNRYNTYLHKGLPIGPISNPGDIAIRAALHPAPGKWLYFVTVNLESGKTVFSTTEAQHEAAAAQFQDWLAKHPSYSK